MAHLQLPQKLEPLFTPARYKVAYGGRGAAKSWGFARALLIQGTVNPLRILCARETQRAIRDSVHRLLADQVITLGLTDHYEILETKIRGRNGTEFVFAGLSSLTVDSIKSFEGVDRCWVEEGQVLSKRSWEILIPTIRKKGSEIWVSFNPDLDTDDTYVRFIEDTPPNCILMPMSWRDNPWFSEVLEQERAHLQKVDPVSYDNVWEGKCRPAALGAIYTPEMTALVGSKRITNVPYDPMLQVHTVWDLGYNDATAIIFVQRHLSELRIIDYREANYTNMAEDVQHLESKGYRYGTDWLPWDGAEGKFKKLGDGVSPEAILRKMGRAVSIVPQTDVEIGIKKARMVFPRCYFDRANTIRLRECLKRYRRMIPVTTGEPSGPLHDEFSHGADAFRYLAMVADQLTDSGKTRNQKIVYPKRSYA